MICQKYWKKKTLSLQASPKWNKESCFLLLVALEQEVYEIYISDGFAESL